MAHYGGQTPKRHYCWSNSPMISALDKGKLHYKAWKNSQASHVQTVRHYQDREGKKRYVGTSKLKGTEFLDTTEL